MQHKCKPKGKCKRKYGREGIAIVNANANAIVIMLANANAQAMQTPKQMESNGHFACAMLRQLRGTMLRDRRKPYRVCAILRKQHAAEANGLRGAYPPPLSDVENALCFLYSMQHNQLDWGPMILRDKPSA